MLYNILYMITHIADRRFTMIKLFKNLWDYEMIILGALIASFSVACIILPNEALDYGTAGIAIIVSRLTGMHLSLAVLIIFLPFLVLGAVSLGREFAIKAGLGSLVYMFGLDIFNTIPFELNTEHFIAVAFGGAALGIGLSLILRYGSCIDGSEILANIVVKKLEAKTGKSYSMTGILIAFNACVYAAAFVLISRNSALLSLLVYIVATFIIDKFTDHYESIKQVIVITNNHEELVDFLKTKMRKTCTIIDSQGAIAGDNKTIICYVNYFELQQLRAKLRRMDGFNFSTVITIDEIIK